LSLLISLLFLLLFFHHFFLFLKKQTAPWLNAFLFGFSFFSIGLYWLILCIVNYGGASWFSALTLCLLFYIFLGLFFLPFALIKKNAFAHAIILLTLLEIIREYLFTGFPWLSLGFSQVSNPLINQYFSVIGSHGITMTILLISALSFKVIERKNKKVIPAIGIIIIIILVNFMLPLTQPQPDNETKLKISLLQGNVGQI
jgi:apolipoprotein N-acyltransferase